MKNRIAILCTLLVFAALALDKTLLRPPAAIADAYHDEVRKAAEAVPRHFGPWLGVDVPVPPAAVRLLKPNAIVSRRYTNIATGEAVSFLVVQVRDSRDILGHYPPVCYPAQGWTRRATQPMEWNGATQEFPGTRYGFDQEGLEGGVRITIDNFLILPDGTICPDMNAVESMAQDRVRKVFGAAQVQLIYNASVSADRQTQITEEFLRFFQPVVNAISGGERHVTKN